MLTFVYKCCQKVQMIFYRAYVKSQLHFSSKLARKTIKIDNGVKIYNPNVLLGENIHLFSNCVIWGDGPVTIGKNVHIGFNTIIYSRRGAGVTIGDNCRIAANCYIIDTNHSTTLKESFNINNDTFSPICISAGAWISAGCVIAKGSYIGKNAIIGANSFVNKEINDNAIAVGSPAKIIKYRS